MTTVLESEIWRAQVKMEEKSKETVEARARRQAKARPSPFINPQETPTRQLPSSPWYEPSPPPSKPRSHMAERSLRRAGVQRAWHVEPAPSVCEARAWSPSPRVPLIRTTLCHSGMHTPLANKNRPSPALPPWRSASPRTSQTFS